MTSGNNTGNVLASEAIFNVSGFVADSLFCARQIRNLSADMMSSRLLELSLQKRELVTSVQHHRSTSEEALD